MEIKITRNIILYIFIYIILTGCEGNNVVGGCQSDCFLNINAPALTMNENGIYELEWIDGYNQTFTTLTAYTNSTDVYQHVGWMSAQEININGYWVNLVNGNSYTDELGEAHTVLGVWEEFINDTIMVYSGYTDQCNIQYIDSLKFIIK